MKLSRYYLSLWLLAISAMAVYAQNKILITEFMASNAAFLADEDGEFSDWIELYNASEESINLEGWYLTDKSDNLTKWKVPNLTLAADDYLLVFASEKNRKDPTQPLHTNFKLSASGEFLAVVEPDGVTISHAYSPTFPVQREDISFGIYQEQNVFFDEPTPGADNVLGQLIPPPQFSHNRGFYDDNFQVSLNSVGNGSKIYYTTDGTRPNPQSGMIYSQPINIATTTPLSAVVVSADGLSSEIISHTYFFIKDIVQQPVNPAGYPSEWSPYKFRSGNAPADYEMDPEVCNHPDYKELMDDALLSIPTLSIVTNTGYLFSHEKNSQTGGIYIFTGNSGEGGAGTDWERPASVEYYEPTTQRQFQVNCGVRLHGGNSRIPDNSQKHSFRLSFRSLYGPSKLKFDLFEESTATDEFNSLVLRAGYNYSWTKNDPTQRRNAQFMQDPFAKATQRAMGYPSAHEQFVHLYLNGLYWGLYNISEKITNDFMESYLGGKEEDFDVIKDHGLVADGFWTDWTKLYNQAKAGLSSNADYQKVQGKNPDGSVNPNLLNLLDVDNLIGYMQYNMYIGNEDWDHNNWFAARNRVTNEAGFRFFAWDAETSMTNLNYNNVKENNEENPSWFYTLLQGNADFKMLFADRLQQNFLNGGPLSPEAAAARYQEMVDEIDLAIIAESARWGDYRKDVAPSDNDRVLYTRNGHWLPRKEYLMNTYFPQRSGIVLNQFREIGLFPNIQAPAFSHPGGDMTTAIELEMSTNYGDIYFTTDGSDPRMAITGALSRSAQLYSGKLPIGSSIQVRARAKSGNEWSPITEAGYEFTTGTNDVAPAAILSGSYPNPFTEATTIYYSLTKPSRVKVTILDLSGRKLATLFSGVQTAGTQKVFWEPESAVRGLFLYQIQAGDQVVIGKLVRE